MAPVKSKPASLLIGVCILGLALSAALAGGLAFISLYGDLFPPASGSRDETSFSRKLSGYDTALAAGTEIKKLAALLDGLEKSAPDVESHLSVLKRRRFLALGNSGPEKNYRAALGRAEKAFPFSEFIAALAAEAVLDREFPGPGIPAGPISPETAEALQEYAARMSRDSLMPLAFGIYALTGAMETPEKAAALPRAGELFASVFPLLQGEEKNGLLVDLAVLRLIGGDIQGAAALADTLIQDVSGSSGAIRFAAEFLYDYDDPLEAARLFARLPTEEDRSRHADALVLAGYQPRNVWLAMVSSGENSPVLKAKALYNLALTAGTRTEQLSWLEQLIAAGNFPENAESNHEALNAGIIRYTRLFDTPRTLAILEGLDRQRNSMLDLEYCRRMRDEWTVDRTLAETWLLLGRHPGDERIYQWGAYYFDRQRQYGETALLLQRARRGHMENPRLQVHQGLELIREGQLEAGESLLKSLSMDIWQVPANLARIQEARRSAAGALEYYEIAASRVKNPVEAAKIQLRIARCLRALGRDGEIRRVLQYGRDLDPENLNIQLELHRLDERRL
jgi:tetratricopeptide (TPR) repeat protein